MAIIYTYPEKSQAEGNDLIVISDSADNNKTKQVKVSSLPSSGGGGDTYALQANAKNGNDIPLVLNAATGTDSTVNITQGANVTLTRNSASQITIAATNTQYDVASSIALGLVKIFSDTEQTVAANTVSAEANRTYGIQLNSSNQAVVNVPWEDSNTQYTAGNGLELSTTTFAADLLADGGIVFSGGNNELGLNLGGTAIVGTLAVARGGTGVNTVGAGFITRGNGTNALVADNKLEYDATARQLKIRGVGGTEPTLSCTLAIDDAQGPSTDKTACIGLTPQSQSQGSKAMHIDLGAYNQGIQIYRNNFLANNALRFFQTVTTSPAEIGTIVMSNSGVAYNTTSDYRLKENVVDMTGAVDRVKQLLPKRFNFKNDPEITVDGFLAHEAQAIVPESVTGNKDEVDANGDAVYQGIDQSKLVPLLVGAIKELTARIEALEA
tara:strand:+ start:426 stop:1742 length:1317 start_codon:yes stop_codon:yes gene_type:complete